MRILAGGGTSEFSEIRMRGPLVLVDGTTVDSAGYGFESFVDGTAPLVWAPAPAPLTAQVLDDTAVVPATIRVSGGITAVPGASVVFRNGSASVRNAVVTYSATLSGEAPPGGGAYAAFVASLVLRVAGVDQANFKPQAELSTLNVPVNISGEAYIENWAVGTDLTFLVLSTAVDTSASVQFASIHIELV
jgi:hypothetical protein